MPAGSAHGRAASEPRTIGSLSVARLLMALVTLLALMLSSGCNRAAGPADGASQVRTSRCPPEYPHRLRVATRAVIGVPPLRGISACVDDARQGPVLLVNQGNAVWATVAPGHPTRMVQRDGQASWLRERVGIPEDLLLPGTAVLVWARPDQIAWRLNREWSVAWASFSAGVAALARSGRDTATAALAPDADTPRGRALVSCALTAWHYYRTAHGDPLPAHDGLGALEMTWSSASSACASDWQSADQVLLANGVHPAAWWTAVSRADAWTGRNRAALTWLSAGTLVMIRVR